MSCHRLMTSTQLLTTEIHIRSLQQNLRLKKPTQTFTKWHNYTAFLLGAPSMCACVCVFNNKRAQISSRGTFYSALQFWKLESDLSIYCNIIHKQERYDLKEKYDLAMGETQPLQTQPLQTCISCYSCLKSASEKPNGISELKIKTQGGKHLSHTWNSALLFLKGVSDVAVN